MEPAADVLAAGAPIDVDISHIQPGQQILISWRSRPIFIVNRSPAELKMLQEAKDTNLLRDPDSENFQQPAYAKNWHRSIKPEYLVLVGICTHLGCIPKGQALGDERGEFGGWFCPCHGSQYDTAGRIRKGPAPRNMEVPPYAFTSDSKIKIG